MSKKEFHKSSKKISEIIFNEYLSDNTTELDDRYDNKLDVLVTHNLAWKLHGSDSLFGCAQNAYRVACKFMQKYNEKIKKYRRRLHRFEFGGKDSSIINNNDKLTKLANQSLEPGAYYCQMSDNDYAKLTIKFDNIEDPYYITYTFYIIGKHWEKYKKKFFKMLDEYNNLSNKNENEYINYMDNRPSVNVIFKPFDKVVMKDKEGLLNYIDNWVSNIPVYYDKYKMISKLSILIYGKPGTGKSTVSRAIAKYLGITSVTSLGPEYFSGNTDDNKNNSRRSKKVYTTGGEETVYTIDDIDCICKSREESDEKENTESLSALLAFLDNPPTFFYHAKNGMDYPISVVIATTNYMDRLDDAVKRYGRFDLKIMMDDFNKEQAQQMCDIYDLRLSDLVDDNIDDENFTISPSYLQALCLENVDKSLKNVK